MAKKIKFESFKYRFLEAARAIEKDLALIDTNDWRNFLRSLEFSYLKGDVEVKWFEGNPGMLTATLKEAKFYVRGDDDGSVRNQNSKGLLSSEDPIKLNNYNYFKRLVTSMAEDAGFEVEHERSSVGSRIDIERDFHDAWADSEDVESIDVIASNQVCTAPEMRYITARLGNLTGKRLLDVGCGLGEASVYFAMQGAEVTSCDLSQGMLNATSRLARHNDVTIKPHLASAEDMKLGDEEKFDVIYAGNLLHHVDIEETIARITPHLADDGLFVSWDPLHYNPAINIYRRMATDVRTPDEHPLKWSDIKLFRRHFSSVEAKYYWLTTLIIFVIMSLAQRRNPNKERYWKVVVNEGDKWEWLYRPLEIIDKFLLKIFPPLRLLCWNVVIICKK